MNTFTKCMEDAIHYNEIIPNNSTMNIVPLDPKDELKLMFDAYCPKAPLAIACVDDFSTVSNVCLFPKEIEVKDKIFRFVKNAITFTCRDNGAHILEVLTEETQTCMNETALIVDECTDAILEQIKPNNRIENTWEAVTSSDNCDDFEKLEKCFTDNIGKCAPKVSQLFENFFDIIWDEMDCKNVNEISLH